MSDDIVDDLHKFTEDTDPFATVPRRLVRNAADEIERLRADLAVALVGRDRQKKRARAGRRKWREKDDQLRRIAARGKQAEAMLAVARNGITQAVEELGDHRQDPTTEGMKHGMCVVCGAADGQWPCVTSMVRADLRRLLTEEQT